MAPALRFLLAAAAIVTTPAVAQDCPRTVDWDKPQSHRAGRSADMRFALKTGTAVQINLSPRRDVRLAAPAGRRADRNSFAGLAALDVPRSGTLEITLSNRTYVDLIRDRRALKSSSHRMPDGCAGIRKIVAFGVKPGRYLVQLTDAPERSVKMATVLR